jgi:hypothetical protein
MLWLEHNGTPQQVLGSVLEFLRSEAARYERQSISARTQGDAKADMARCNALRLAINSLADCNIARNAPG